LQNLLELVCLQSLGSTQCRTSSPSLRKSCAGPFTDNRSLKLGKRCHHVKHQASTGRAGVDVFHDRPEMNTGLAKPVNQVDQSRERAAKPIEPPYDQRAAGLEACQRRIEPITIKA